MYTFDSRIRYSETGSDLKLTIQALLDYFQDCSTFQSEDLGVGFDYVKGLNLVWVLSSWQIEVDRFPALGEQVTVGTFPYNFKGCFGSRNFFMKDSQGNFLAKANSLWTLLDTEYFGPQRLTDKMLESYVIEPKLEMDYAGRKIVVPKGGEMLTPITVHKQHLDTNHHVNNGQYVKIAMEFLPDDFIVKQLRVEYKRQAYLGDIFNPYMVYMKKDEEIDTYYITLNAEDGSIYVNVAFDGSTKESINS